MTRLWALFILLAMALSLGGVAAPPLRKFRATRWGTEQGLPQSRVTCLCLARDGGLWIGTLDGLARFDGRRFQVFAEQLSPDPNRRAVNALYEDPRGVLWVGGKCGLLRFRNGERSEIGAKEGLPFNLPYQILPRKAGGFWVRSAYKLAFFDGSQFHSALIDGKPVDLDPLALALHSGGDLIVAARDRDQLGVWRETPPGELEILARIPLAGSAWPCFFEDRFWAATGGNLLAFAPGNWETPPRVGAAPRRWLESPAGAAVGGVLETRSELPGAATALFQDSGGRLWCNFKPLGLHCLTGGSFHLFEAEGYPPRTQVLCMTEDRQGNLWIGSTDGLFRLTPQLVETLSSADGLKSDSAQLVMEDRDGALWLSGEGFTAKYATNGVTEQFEWGASSFVEMPGGNIAFARNEGIGEVVRILRGREEGGMASFMSPTLPGRQFAALFQDNRDRLWAGHNRGATCFQTFRADPDHDPDLIRIKSIPTEIHPLSEKALTGQSGLPIQLPVGPGVLPGQVRALFQDSKGNYWFGTDGGACRWDGRTNALVLTNHLYFPSEMNEVFRLDKIPSLENSFLALPSGTTSLVRFGMAEGLASSHAWAFHEDRDGVIWIATEGGLSRLEKDRIFSFTTRQGLAENCVNWILEDDAGCLWLSGLKGIHRVRRDDLNRVARGELAVIQCVTLSEKDGMLSSETNGEHQPSGCRTRDGKLWFPTTRGFVMIDPKALPDLEAPTHAHVTRVLANNQALYDDLPIHAGGKGAVGRVELPAMARPLILPPGSGRFLKFQFEAINFYAPVQVRFQCRLRGIESDWRDSETALAAYPNLKPGLYEFQVRARNPHGFWEQNGETFPLRIEPFFVETLLFRILAGGAAGLLILFAWLWRGLWQKRVWQRETESALEKERARIARDLHDEMGARLTGLAFRVDAVERDPSAPLPPPLRDLSSELRSVAGQIRALIWTANPTQDTLESLADFCHGYIESNLGGADLRLRLDFPIGQTTPVGAETRHQLLLCLKEAVANILKHSGASEAQISLAAAGGRLVLEIRDNGKGFAPPSAALRDNGGNGGRGLANVRARAEGLGGSFKVDSEPGHGTCLRIEFPLHPKKENAS